MNMVIVVCLLLSSSLYLLNYVEFRMLGRLYFLCVVARVCFEMDGRMMREKKSPSNVNKSTSMGSRFNVVTNWCFNPSPSHVLIPHNFNGMNREKKEDYRSK